MENLLYSFNWIRRRKIFINSMFSVLTTMQLLLFALNVLILSHGFFDYYIEDKPLITLLFVSNITALYFSFCVVLSVIINKYSLLYGSILQLIILITNQSVSALVTSFLFFPAKTGLMFPPWILIIMIITAGCSLVVRAIRKKAYDNFL